MSENNEIRPGSRNAEMNAEINAGMGGSRIMLLTEEDVVLTESAGKTLVPTEKDLILADAEVDEAGMESFPASDPPSWTSGVDRPPPLPR